MGLLLAVIVLLAPPSTARAASTSCPTLESVKANPSRWIKDITLTYADGTAHAGFVEVLAPGCSPVPITLVAYSAEYAGFLNPITQRVVDEQTGSDGKLEVQLPTCLWQVDLIIGDRSAVIPHLSDVAATYHGRHEYLASLNEGQDCGPNQDRAPVATGASVSTGQDTSLPIQLSGSDPNGYALTYGVVVPPAHGTVSGLGNNVVYTPAPGYHGTDVFSFQVDNGRETSNVADVHIAVGTRNQPPILEQDHATVAANGTILPPEPECTGARCAIAWGDVHLTTFDGLAYNFQGAGEYTLARSTADDLEVQVRTQPATGSRLVSLITAVAARVDGHRVAEYADGPQVDATIDGHPEALTTGEHPLPGGGALTQYGGDDPETAISWPDGSWVSITPASGFTGFSYFAVTMSLAPGRTKMVTGLLGDADGNQANDLTSRTGTAIPAMAPSYDQLYHTFGDTWRIAQSASLFDYAPGTSTETFTDRTFPDRIVTVDDLTSAQRAAASITCAAYGVTASVPLDDCLLDVGLTGDPALATGSAEDQGILSGTPPNVGELALGEPQRITFSDAGTATRSITLPVGENVALEVSNNSLSSGDITLLSSSGSPLASSPLTASHILVGPVAAGSAGPETVQVRAMSAGSLDVEAVIVPANSGTIAVGATAPLSFDTPGEVATRTFVGHAGQQVKLSVSADTVGTVDISLQAPDGSTILAQTISSSGESFDPTTLPAEGEYTLVAAPRNGATGELDIALSGIPLNPGQITFGESVQISITTAGENATRTFAGTAGQMLTLTTTGDTIPGAEIYVQDSQHNNVAAIGVGPPGGFLDTFTLPADGTYTVLVDPEDQDTGQLTFTLNNVPSTPGLNAAAQVSAGGAPASSVQTLRLGRATDVAIAAHVAMPLVLPNGRTRRISIEIGRDTVNDSLLKLVDARGRTLQSWPVRAPWRFIGPVQLPAGSQAQFVISPHGADSGNLTILVRPVPVNRRALRLGTSEKVTLAVPGESAERTFAASKGDRLRITVSDAGFGSGTLLVRRLGGPAIAHLGLRFAAPKHDAPVVLTSQPLRATGRYEAVIDANTVGVGSIRLAIDRSVRSRRSSRSRQARTGKRQPRHSTTRRRAVVHRQLRLTTATPMPPPAGPGFQTMFRLPESAAAAAPAQATVSPGAFTSILANAAISPTRHTLTLQDTDLLANDAPGPPSEATTQSLHVTQLIAGQDTHGTLARTPAGVITYVPEDGFTGDAEFDYQACDDGTTEGQPDPLCAEASVIVEVVPDQPPQISGQHASTAEDIPLSIQLTASDPEGDPITYRIDTPPASGTVTGDGPSFTYTPAHDFNGTDSFTVVASDGQADSQPAEVGISVTPVNDPPRLTDDALTAQPGQPLSIPAAALLHNDAPGPANELAQTLDLSSVAAVADTHGTVVLNNAGTVVYTPDAGYSGPAEFTYTACDNGTTDGAADPRCATAEVNVTVQPEAPPVASPQTLNVKQGGSIPITLVGTGPDPAGLTYAVASTPADGQLTGTAPHLTYTPNANFVGTDSFTFTVSDGSVLSSPASITVQVSSGTPPQTTPDGAAVAPGSHVLVDVLANDTPGAAPLDPSALRVLNAPTRGTASVSDGEILYTPAAATNSGQDTFTYDACDANGDCATGTAVITITADLAPTTHADAYDVDMGKTFSETAPGVLGNDPGADGQTHVELVNGVHAGQLLLQGDGSFTYTPDASFTGVDSFTYVAVSPAGARSAPTVVSLTVTDDGLIGSDDDYTTQQDVPLVVAAPGVLTNDSDTHSTTPDLSAEVVDQPNAGQLTLLRDGTVDYTPDPSFAGDDSFTYTTSTDGGRVSQPNQVVIHVVAPPAPVPTIGAVGPADGTRVTSPVPVTATITPAGGDSIKQWSVTERDMDGGTPTTIASGQGAPPATLATFDPTLLRNGTYEVAIRATSAKGAIASASHTYAVAGDMKLGDYTTTYDDMDVTIGGVPIQIQRTYDTKDHRYDDFGYGWSLQLSSYRATPNGALGQGGWKTTLSGGLFPSFDFSSSVLHFVTITAPGGPPQIFDLAPAPSGPLLGLTEPAFVARLGTTGTLEDADPPVLSLSGGSLRGFLTGVIYDPQRFRLTEPDGTVLIIDRQLGLVSVIDRHGNEFDIGHDGIRSATTGEQVAFKRDPSDRIVAITSPAGQTAAYTYNSDGTLATSTAADATKDAFSYDNDRRLNDIMGPGSRRVRTLTYDAQGRLTSITDSTGATTAVRSDISSRTEIVTSPSGRLTTINSYDPTGELTSTENDYVGRSEVTRFGYDANSNLTSETSPGGHTEHWTFDALGHQTSFTTANGGKYTTTYNAFGQPTRTAAPDGSLQQSESYDAQGDLVSEFDANAGTTKYTYDDSGLMQSSTGANGTTRYRYDDNGRATAIIDPLDQTTGFAYDADGNLTSETAPDGGVTSIAYAPGGQITSVVGPTGERHSFTYDNFGYVASETSPGNRITTFVNDGEGRRVKQVDPEGGTTTWTYDEDGFLTDLDYPGGTEMAIENDALGRPVKLTYDGTVDEQSFDADGNISQQQTFGTPGVALPDTTLSFAHDDDGNLTALTGPSGQTSYSYDAEDDLVGVTSDTGGKFVLGRDAGGRLVSLTRPNGIDDGLTYNGTTLVSRVAARNGTTLSGDTATVNGADLRSSFTDDEGTTQLTHDAAGRLTSAAHPATSSEGTESFTYDKLGNRTSWNGSPTATVAYGPGSQLLSDGTYNYAYDPNGQLISRTNRATGAITQYAWNGAGQLVSVTAPDGSKTTYRYDAFGRRVQVDTGTGAQNYVYAGWNVVDGFLGSNLSASYTVGTFPGEVYEMQQDNSTEYPLVDLQNSVTALTNQSGSILGRTRYSAFGSPTQSGANNDTYAFTGYQWDSNTGLFYSDHRYYDPRAGRFLSQDPEPALSPYAYAGDKPYDLVDPTGEEAGTEKVTIECRVSWNAEQRAAALAKIEQLQAAAAAGKLKVVLNPVRDPYLTSWYRDAVGLGDGFDADHVIELVLGGEDDPINLLPLDSTVNRSFGAQLGRQLLGRDGEPIREVVYDESACEE